MKTQLNRKYAASQAINSSLLATMFAFASIFLLDKGLANSSIGMILALCNVAAIIVQTFFANFTSKHKSIKLQDTLTFMLIIIMISSVVLFMAPSPILFIIAVIVAFSFAKSNTPFVNSLAFIYEEEGVLINYGVGRGFGSLAYALVNLALGFVIKMTTPNVLPVFYMGLALIFIFIIRSYRLPQKKQSETVKMSAEPVKRSRDSISIEEQSLAGFVSKYRELVWVILGLVFVIFAQTLVGTFMIQIVTPVGGDSSSVGIAIFIAAAVEFPVMTNFDKLLKKQSAAFWLKLSLIFFMVKIIVLFFATNLWMIYFSQFLQLGAYALAYPAAVQYIKNTVDKKDLFKGQSLFTIGLTMSGVLSSFMGGLILDHYGVSSMIFTAFLSAIIGSLVIYGTLHNIPEQIRTGLAARN